MATDIRSSTRGLRSEVIRQANLTAILRSIHLDGPASRSDLVQRTGLTRSAVGALVGELAQLGLVEERRAGSGGTPGRPSPVVSARVHDHVVIAIEALVDSTAVAVVGLGGRILASERSEQARSAPPVEVAVADLTRRARQLLAGLPAEVRVHGIGIAVPGIVRRSDNTVVVAPNLEWRDAPLGALFADAFGTDLPAAVANDADLGAIAEVRRGAAAGFDHVLYVSGEVGVGGGIVAHGAPIHGTAGFAGEIGHLSINPGGTQCSCGAIGCWETEIGEHAILRRCGYPTDGGPPAIDAVVVAASEGDARVLAALDETGRWIGLGLAGLINVLDPQIVVLGGLFGRLYPFLHASIRREVDSRAFGDRPTRVRIEPAALGADSLLLGAAEIAWEPILADPASVAASTVRAGHLIAR